MKSMTEIAIDLAEAHRKIEPGIERIVRLSGSPDDRSAGAVMLLEVNPDTPPLGIMPIALGPSGDVPYPAILVEVTPEEFDRLKLGSLELPKGWKLEETLYPGEERDGIR